jgi:hypothetical protein
MTDDSVRVWLVERTYSDDEQNMLILVYATPDGERYHRKERALTSLHGGVPDVEAAIDVDPDQLGAVTDAEERSYYVDAAGRTAENHDPDDVV